MARAELDAQIVHWLDYCAERLEDLDSFTARYRGTPAGELHWWTLADLAEADQLRTLLSGKPFICSTRSAAAYRTLFLTWAEATGARMPPDTTRLDVAVALNKYSDALAVPNE